MQEKPPFSSYIDFFSNVREGDTPSHTHPLRTLNLSSGTPLVIRLEYNLDVMRGFKTNHGLQL